MDKNIFIYRSYKITLSRFAPLCLLAKYEWFGYHNTRSHLSPFLSVGTVLIFLLFRYCCLGSYGFTVPVSVPQFRFLMLETRVSVQGILESFSFFLFLLLNQFHCGTISIPNQVEPKALLLKPKLTET